MDMINPNEIQNPELTRELERQNKENGLEILEMKPMRRKLKDNARHFSLVVFCSSSEMADKCIKHGIYINHQRFFPEKYTPQFQLIQCYKCQQFGHHALSAEVSMRYVANAVNITSPPSAIVKDINAQAAKESRPGITIALTESVQSKT